VEIYPEELLKQIRYTSALFDVDSTREGVDRLLLDYIEIRGCYSDGKRDVFYTKERKYIRLPEVKYYIFDYIYDTISAGEDGLIVIKVIKDARVFDNNESLDDLENIPYTSPQFQITGVIEHNIFFKDAVISYIRIDVMYHLGEADYFYTTAFNYRNLSIYGYYIFDYIYDTILKDSLEAYGINDNLVNVKVITDIRRDLYAWPGLW
jgi:hypothetical protein